MTLAEARRRGVEIFERRYLEELLSQNRSKIKDSARAAGISTRQLHKLLTKYGIKKEAYKTAPT
jgi:two-component system response regulator AtoC